MYILVAHSNALCYTCTIHWLLIQINTIRASLTEHIQVVNKALLPKVAAWCDCVAVVIVCLAPTGAVPSSSGPESTLCPESDCEPQPSATSPQTPGGIPCDWALPSQHHVQPQMSLVPPAYSRSGLPGYFRCMVFGLLGDCVLRLTYSWIGLANMSRRCEHHN